MITCPICGKLVHLDNDGRGTNTYVTDGDTSDFYCPTYVDVYPGVRWGHYVKKKVHGSYGSEYVAVIPPFYICWWDATQRLTVKQFGVYPEDWRMHKIIYQANNVSEEDLSQIYQRFTNLKVFS